MKDLLDNVLLQYLYGYVLMSSENENEWRSADRFCTKSYKRRKLSRFNFEAYFDVKLCPFYYLV